jgi:hypothetical protein
MAFKAIGFSLLFQLKAAKRVTQAPPHVNASFVVDLDDL